MVKKVKMKHIIFTTGMICLFVISIFVYKYVSLEPFDFTPSWSSDGQQIAYVCHRRLPRIEKRRFDIPYNGPRHLELLEICVLDFNSGIKQQLTKNRILDAGPVWDPKGEYIAFLAYPEDNGPDIYTIQANGSDLTNLTPGELGVRDVKWSPEGNHLAFTTRDNHQDALYVMQIRNLQPMYLSTIALWGDFEWSPDGTHIAFIDGITTEKEIYIVSVNDKSIKQLTDTPSQYTELAWDPMGQYIAFVAGRNDSYQAYIMDISTRTEYKISEERQRPAREVSWSPNGRFLSYVKGQLDEQTLYLLEFNTKKLITFESIGFVDTLSWNPNSQYLLVNRSDDWNGDEAYEPKLWLLDMNTNTLSPISYQFPWRGQAEQLTPTLKYFDNPLP